MFNRINILDVLKKKQIVFPGDALLNDVQEILKTERSLERSIEDRLMHRTKKDVELAEPVTPFDLSDVYSIDAIRSTCIDYRLRFLDSSLFKGKVPAEAILKIKNIEKEHGVTFESFKIMAPVSMFNLADPNKDPLLFARLANGQFHFIHKWGNDLTWIRKFFAFPFRNFTTFLVFLVSLSVLVNLFIPSDWIASSERYRAQEYSIRGFLIIHFFLLFCGMSLFFFFSKGRGVSELEWNNRYSS